MMYKISIKKSFKCENCKGLGFYTFDQDNNNNCKHGKTTVEYYCNNCEGKGKIWKTIDMPLKSFKSLLK